MKLAIIGQGGHSKVIEDMVVTYNLGEIVARLDDEYHHSSNDEMVIKGPIGAASRIAEIDPSIKFVIAIGNNQVRKEIVKKLGIPRERYATLIHPTAIISASSTIGTGCVILARTVIQAEAIIGDQTIVNTGAIVEHDNVLEEYVHLSPGVVLTGKVVVREGAHIGAGTVIIPGRTIGRRAVIGAGATVIHDIPDHATAVGIPAKVIKQEVIIQ